MTSAWRGGGGRRACTDPRRQHRQRLRRRLPRRPPQPHRPFPGRRLAGESNRRGEEGMASIAYLDCFSGISGDMLLGALLDAGLSVQALRRELAKLGLKGYRLKAKKTRRGGLGAPPGG